jgi:hypothetical protein
VKLVVIAAFAAALLAIGGVAFAWGGGGGCHGDGGGGGCDSQPNIEWVSPTSTIGGPHTVHCAVTPTSSTLTASATALYPGTECWLNGTLENAGNSPVQLVPHISATLPHGCTVFTYSDNLLSASPDVTLAQGHTFAYRAVYGLAATAGNSCEKVTAAFQVTITASGSPSCQGFSFNPKIAQDGGCCG